jgi:hypothetical protein
MQKNSLIQDIKQVVSKRFVSSASDTEIFMESKKRFGQEKISEGVVPFFTSQRIITLEEWKRAVDLATNPITYNRWLFNQCADSAMLDLHLSSIIETRTLDLQSSKFKLKDPSGKEDTGAKEMLEAQWYNDYIQYAFESRIYEHSLIELFDLDMSEVKKVNTNQGMKTFYPIKEANLIPRGHVRPELGKWYVNHYDDISSGYSYLDEPSDLYYMSVGKKTGLGLMKKLIPMSIAKRFSIGAWGEFDEKLGVPFRWVTMRGRDQKRERALSNIMDKMGVAGWAILNEGEQIQLLQTAGSDVHKCFMELGNFCDKQMSKAILGSTMTVDAEGGQYKGDVHEATTEIRHLADKTFIQYLNNDQLIKRLVKRGYPLAGYKYEIDETKELSIKDQIAVDTVLLQYYDIDEKYIADKYDVPLNLIKGKSPKNIQDVVSETQKKKVQPKNSSIVLGSFEGALMNTVNKLYFGDKCCSSHSENISHSSSSFGKINDLITKIFNQEIKKGDLDEGLFDWQVKKLVKGLQEGHGEDFASFSFDKEDSDMINAMKQSTFTFTAFKNYQEIRSMADLLVDEEGKIKTLSQYKKDALKLHDTYDSRYAAVEYDHAIVSAQAVRMWGDFVKNKDRFPMLKYNAVMDGATTPICSALNGFKARVDSPIWSRYMIPNHFNERSTIDADIDGEESDTKGIDLPEPKGIFDRNVGLDGIVFPPSHPYFQASKAQKDKVNKFAEDKFNPKKDAE